MLPFVFGNDFNSVAQQQNYYDSLGLRKLEADRQANADAYNRALSTALTLRHADDASNLADRNFVFQQQQADLGQQNRLRTEDNDLYKFNTEVGLRGNEDANRNQLSAADLDLRKKQYDFNRIARDQDGDYAEAVQRIRSGEIDDPAKLAALYPKMSPIQMSRAQDIWKEENRRQNEDYKSLEGSGAQLNALVNQARAGKRAAMFDADLKNSLQGINMPRWLGGGGTEGTLKDESLAARKLAPDDKHPLPELSQDEVDQLVANNKHLGKTLNMLTWNSKAQRFEPIIRKPTATPDASTQLADRKTPGDDYVFDPAMFEPDAPQDQTPAPRFVIPSTNSVPAPAALPIGRNGSTVTDFSASPARVITPAPVPAMPANYVFPGMTNNVSDVVRVRTAAGTVGTIPRKNLQAALARGAIPLE